MRRADNRPAVRKQKNQLRARQQGQCAEKLSRGGAPLAAAVSLHAIGTASHSWVGLLALLMARLSAGLALCSREALQVLSP
jgi:hypothetical protein